MRFASLKHALVLAWVSTLWILATAGASDTEDAQAAFQHSGNTELDTYDSLIKENPDNFMAVFKRGLLYLSQRKDWKAMQDFVKVLEIEPSMGLAKQQLKRLHVKFGIYDTMDDDETIKLPNVDEEASEISIRELRNMSEQVKRDLDSSQYENCITTATQVLAVSPSHRVMRKYRAECQIHAGYLVGALNDLLWVENLHGTPASLGGEPFNAETYVTIAAIYYYFQNDYDKAMSQLRRCLQFDPDNKSCKAIHKAIRTDNKEMKKILKDNEDWPFIIKHFVQKKQYEAIKRNVMKHFQHSPPDMVRMGPYLQSLGGKICEAIYHLNEVDPNSIPGQSGCDDVIDFESDDADQSIDSPSFFKLLVKLQKMISQKRYADAVNLAANYHTWDHRITSLYSEARSLYSKARQEQFHQRQQQQGGHYFNFNFGGGGGGYHGSGGSGGSGDLAGYNMDLDFYKVLEVPSSASEKEIKAAYRRLSKIYHPDKYRGDLDPVSKMADINEAYSVLSSESLRTQYDSQRSGHGNANAGAFGNTRRQRSGGNPFFQQNRRQ